MTFLILRSDLGREGAPPYSRLGATQQLSGCFGNLSVGVAQVRTEKSVTSWASRDQDGIRCLERGEECEERRIDLVGVQIHLSAGDGARHLLKAQGKPIVERFLTAPMLVTPCKLDEAIAKKTIATAAA